ncbi:MAG TPA: OB-fold nucleic acid binding domain-containing protein [Candidatus Nanoarchaeia archaeon]|nr:OB-fold nucleic acid binding domain-containing protein [Candidatus Nanoarchaeia archaeon]
MIKIPYEEIVLKINEKTQMSVTEIEERIEKKMKQLSGLISKEGAAHIVANELGVKLLEQTSGKLQIKNIMKGMRDVETVGRVMQVYEIREFMKGDSVSKVASVLIGDETGTIRIVMWGSQADNALKLSGGDIVKVVGGYIRENNSRIEIHMNEKSQLTINPSGVTVKDVVVTTKIGTRKTIKELSENDNDVELLGTVVQAFDIKFYEVCPRCSKRARPSSDLYQCAEHGNVIPAYSYVFNVVLDDGTETLRCVFFRNQVEKLVNMTQEQLLKFRSNPADFEAVKHDLLGKIIKVTGRANKNAMFNRIEFVANSVDNNPSAEEEIKKLQGQ